MGDENRAKGGKVRLCAKDAGRLLLLPAVFVPLHGFCDRAPDKGVHASAAAGPDQ